MDGNSGFGVADASFGAAVQKHRLEFEKVLDHG
jgi:hypothetical protein